MLVSMNQNGYQGYIVWIKTFKLDFKIRWISNILYIESMSYNNETKEGMFCSRITSTIVFAPNMIKLCVSFVIYINTIINIFVLIWNDSMGFQYCVILMLFQSFLSEISYANQKESFSWLQDVMSFIFCMNVILMYF